MASKTPEQKLLESLDLSREVIDVEGLRGFRRPTIARWLVANMREINQHTIDKLRHILQTRSVSNATEAHIRKYCKETEYNKAASELRKDPPKLKRPLPAVVCFSSYYDISCHELLFRSQTPAVMSRKAEAFVSKIIQLPDSERNRICFTLRGGHEPTQNLQYILKIRLLELSADLGIDFDEMIWSPAFADFSKDVITEFIGENTCPWQNTNTLYENSNDLLSSFSLMNVVYLVCIYYNISADRLLLQDYSRFAVTSEGEPLTQDQMKYLSLFLCANPTAQSIAIQDLVLALYGSGKEEA